MVGHRSLRGAGGSPRFRLLRLSALGLLTVTLCSASSCEDDDFDHDPPPGQGSIIIDNNTFDDISVFIDGARFPDARDGKRRTIDLDPDVYRVVLEQQGGRHSFRDDVDVLENRLTVLDVAFGDGFTYDVLIFFE